MSEKRHLGAETSIQFTGALATKCEEFQNDEGMLRLQLRYAPATETITITTSMTIDSIPVFKCPLSRAPQFREEAGVLCRISRPEAELDSISLWIFIS